jgi:hypothetical protein
LHVLRPTAVKEAGVRDMYVYVVSSQKQAVCGV